MKFRNISIKNLLPKIKALFPPSSAQQQPRDRSVLLLPNPLFFSQRVSIPEGITEEDYDSFAEITLEDLAPFPVESLAWGYAVEANTLLIYAAPKDRLKAYEHADTAFHVFPAFLCLRGHKVSAPSVAFLRLENTLSAISLSPESTLPSPLHGIDLGEDAPDEAFFEARETLAEQYKKEGTILCEGIFRVEDASALSEGSVLFTLSSQADPDALLEELQPHILEAGEPLWQADIRDAMAKYAFKKTRELSKRLWLSLKIAAGAAAFILFLELISAIAGWVASSRESTINTQTPEVARIEDSQQLLDKLNQFYNEELKPFDLLDILNEIRPRSIYFTSVASESFNDIEVRGLASNVEEVNAYTSALEEAPQVLSVELTDILTRQGKVNFTLKAKIDLTPPPEEIPEDEIIPAEKIPPVEEPEPSTPEAPAKEELKDNVPSTQKEPEGKQPEASK